MAEGLKAGGVTKSFDLFKNPFFILGVEPTASLEEIAEAFDDALADHAVSETLLAEAREALVTPRQRTVAELSFFLDTRPKEVELIYAALKRRASVVRRDTWPPFWGVSKASGILGRSLRKFVGKPAIGGRSKSSR